MTEEKRPAAPDTDEVHTRLEAALFEIKCVIVGQEDLLERVFVALLTDGHLLIEGVPGLAKTLTVKTVEVRRTGAGHVVLSTNEDWLRALAAFVRRPPVHKRVGKHIQKGAIA